MQWIIGGRWTVSERILDDKSRCFRPPKVNIVCILNLMTGKYTSCSCKSKSAWAKGIRAKDVIAALIWISNKFCQVTNIKVIEYNSVSSIDYTAIQCLDEQVDLLRSYHALKECAMWVIVRCEPLVFGCVGRWSCSSVSYQVPYDSAEAILLTIGKVTHEYLVLGASDSAWKTNDCKSKKIVIILCVSNNWVVSGNFLLGVSSEALAWERASGPLLGNIAIGVEPNTIVKQVRGTGHYANRSWMPDSLVTFLADFGGKDFLSTTIYAWNEDI